MRLIVDIAALKAQAERAALAQEDLASRADEDSQHWHHVMLANLIRTMAALIHDEREGAS